MHRIHPRRLAIATTAVSLPDGFQPEGIAAEDETAYLGSLADGRGYQVDLATATATGTGSVLAEGDGTPSVGLALEDDRLFVAGAPTVMPW